MFSFKYFILLLLPLSYLPESLSSIPLSSLIESTGPPVQRIVRHFPTNAMGRRGSESRPTAPKVRLSCQTCQQRKVKCNKLSPCSQCQRLGLDCVPVERARLPRGRSQRPAAQPPASNPDVENRMARLERLLPQLAGESAAGYSDISADGRLTGAEVSMAAIPNINNLEAWKPDLTSNDPFWASSTHQVRQHHFIQRH